MCAPTGLQSRLVGILRDALTGQSDNPPLAFRPILV
jgi:hypothetical protein